MTTGPAPRRTVLAALPAVFAAVASVATVPTALAAGGGGAQRAEDRAGGRAESPAPAGPGEAGDGVDYRGWSTYPDWSGGEARGVRVEAGRRPGIVIATPVGTTQYTDPHTGRTASWDYATWTSPAHRLPVPAREIVPSWNAHTPPGTWLRIELQGMYTDGTFTPWYTLGVWAAGDGDIRRTSVDGQDDGRSSVSTDTLAINSSAGALRLASYRLRVFLYRAPGSGATPTVWRVGAMGSDVPGRFEVPAVEPGEGAGVEVPVPRYSQEIHIGRYPEYDNGGEAWCSPTSTQMIVEYWGRKPTAEDLAWVDPEFDDPQVCHAARFTYDHQYEGCGNWPFNTAYASTYRDMQGIVTRLGSLSDAERLISAGIPLITSQSFREDELDGAGYGTAGHLMTVIGFTRSGDVIANDPASPDNNAVRRVYKRRQWENIWLRTKRYDAKGRVASGTGGLCYLIWPTTASAAQLRVLGRLGIR